MPARTCAASSAARDYHEVVTYSFIDSRWEEDFCGNAHPVALANPIASQMNVMRSSLIPGLVDCVAFNVRHKQSRVRVFEIGRCFMGGARITRSRCASARPRMAMRFRSNGAFRHGAPTSTT